MVFFLFYNQVEESLGIFDVDGDGWISRGQIKHLICSQTGEGLTEDEFEELLDNIPGNEDGMIRVADFAHLLNQGGLPTVTDLQNKDSSIFCCLFCSSILCLMKKKVNIPKINVSQLLFNINHWR